MLTPLTLSSSLSCVVYLLLASERLACHPTPLTRLTLPPTLPFFHQGEECFGMFLPTVLLPCTTAVLASPSLACPSSPPSLPLARLNPVPSSPSSALPFLRQGAECFGVFLQWGLDKVVLKDIWDRVAGDAGHLTAPQVRLGGGGGRELKDAGSANSLHLRCILEG